MPWDPQCYTRFEAERAAPFLDLLGLIRPQPDMRVVDLGCGPGSLTLQLAEALPGSDVLGIDSSPEMLRQAEALARPGLRFAPGLLQELTGQYDLIFSHAALHWVEDHPALFSRLWSHLAPGGQLAVQMPSNHDHPTHRAVLTAAAEEPFRSALQGFSRSSPVLPLRAYAELLYGCGAESQVTFEKVYPHVLEDAGAMVQWVRGTTMVPYLERLEPTLQDDFLERCRELVEADFPGSPVFYGFKRVLLWAGKPG